MGTMGLPGTVRSWCSPMVQLRSNGKVVAWTHLEIRSAKRRAKASLHGAEVVRKIVRVVHPVVYIAKSGIRTALVATRRHRLVTVSRSSHSTRARLRRLACSWYCVM